MLDNVLTEPWKSFFTEIDNDLVEEVILECLGAFVLTMRYGLNRPTTDVDCLPIGSHKATTQLQNLAGEGSKLHKKYRVYLQFVGIAQLDQL